MVIFFQFKNCHNKIKYRMMKSIFMLMLMHLHNAYRVSDFQGQIFKFNNLGSGIYQVDVNLNNFKGIMMAYADVNNDKATDIITINQQGNNIQFLYWTGDGFETVLLKPNNIFSNATNIIGVTPADYNYDGLVDLMIVADSNSPPYQIYFWMQTSTQQDGYPVFQQNNTIPIMSETIPMAGDFMGDHNMAVLIYENNQRQLVSFPDLAANQTFISYTTGCANNQLSYYQTLASQKLDEPNYSATVDVNSDCRADLMILSVTSDTTNPQQNLEYWYTNIVDDKIKLNQRFCLGHVDQLTGVQVHSLSFVDLNFDGLVDMVSVVSPQSDFNQQYMVINYNGMTGISNSALCQNGMDVNYSYPYENIALTNSTLRMVTPLVSNGVQFMLYDFSDSQMNQSAQTDAKSVLGSYIRFGDLKSTGYPSAFATLWNISSSYGAATYYIENVECSGEDCSQLAIPNKRMLLLEDNPNLKGLEQLSQIPTMNVAFFDFGENGRLDFLMNLVNQSFNGPTFNTIKAYYNYLSLDAFYLKALGLNGQCPSSNDGNLQCQGALYYGTTYQFSVTDINGQYHPSVGVQLSQSASTPLQLPYAYMGLGRTNNYVEDFYAGIPLMVQKYLYIKNGAKQKWSPIIPNSQLIMNPQGDDPAQWQLSIFIEPTHAILVVVIVTIIVLVLLGGVIIWKHIKEKEEDKKTQETFFQMFR